MAIMSSMNRDSLNEQILVPAVTLMFFGLATMLTSSDLYWGESSLFAARSWVLGAANPPGYPLFLMLLFPFQKLCFGDIIARSNMLGNLIYAVAAGAFFFLMNRLSGSKIIAISTACILFLSGPVLQSIAAVEVYSLNILFFTVLLILLSTDLSMRGCCLVFFFCGLMVSHHLTLVLILPGLLILLLRDSRWTLKYSGIYLLFFLMGLSVLLYPIIRESVIPSQTWGDADSLSGFISLVTASEESSASFLAGISSFTGVINRGQQILFSLIRIIGWIGIPFVLIGIFSTLRRNKTFSLFIFLTFVLFTAAVVSYQSNEAVSFFIPGIIILIIWLGEGLAVFRKLICKYLSISDGFKGLTITLICLAFCLIPLGQISQVRSDDVHFPRCLASELADRSGDSSVLITRRSDISFLLNYLRTIEGRHNNPVIFQHLLSFKWYYRDLSDSWPDLVHPDLLKMPFEDSYNWNSAVTASLVKTSAKTRDVWLADPEIVNDIHGAGLSPLYLKPEAFFSRLYLKESELPDPVTVDVPVRFTGRFDGISQEALAGHFLIRSRFFHLAGDVENAKKSYAEARRLKMLGHE